jgi:hypothetical protein
VDRITPRADGLPAVVEAVTRLRDAVRDAALGGDEQAVADRRFELTLLLGHNPDGLGRRLRNSDRGLPLALREALGELWDGLGLDALFEPDARGQLLAYLDAAAATLSADYGPDDVRPDHEPEDISILAALSGHRDRRLSLSDISMYTADPPVCRNHVCGRIGRLVAFGLVDRRGRRGGYRVTPEGLDALARWRKVFSQ